MNIQEFRTLTKIPTCSPMTFRYFEKIYMGLKNVDKQEFCAAVGEAALEYEENVAKRKIAETRKCIDETKAEYTDAKSRCYDLVRYEKWEELENAAVDCLRLYERIEERRAELRGMTGEL